jgi:hypothetical protein
LQAYPDRRSVDLSEFPDLVMILLGFRVRGWTGLAALRRIGPGLRRIEADRPDGLLGHDNMLFGWNHFGFRQYWRNFETLEAFTRSEPHADWWRRIRELSAGAGFWHETYHARGGVEAVYVGMPTPVGLQAFAPERKPVGPFNSARSRLQGGAMHVS